MTQLEWQIPYCPHPHPHRTPILIQSPGRVLLPASPPHPLFAINLCKFELSL